MSKSILIMYWHGLGDLLCLTPQLRYLSQNGFQIDLLTRPQVLSSRLLNACSYVRKVFPLPFTGGGPAEGGESGKKKRADCLAMYEDMRAEYDAVAKIVSLHNMFRHPGGKIDRNSHALFGSRGDAVDPLEPPAVVPLEPPTDLNLEVFINPKSEAIAKAHIEKHYPNGFIFKHTTPEDHPSHNWDARRWMEKNLPKLPVFEADSSKWDDINVAFVMAREATHRVLSSSVFVHACDAMNTIMDVVHYGSHNPHGLPLDPGKIATYHNKWNESHEDL